VEDPAAPNSSLRRRRRRRSRFNKDSLQKGAKDEVPDGDPRDESNLGLVVVVAVGLVLVLLVTYIAGQMQYEAAF